MIIIVFFCFFSGSSIILQYVSASFGSPPPIGLLDVYFPDVMDVFGCSFGDSGLKLTDKAVIVLRGGCTFLDKAVQAYKANALVLIIVNNEDKLESPSSGLWIEDNITESVVLSVKPLSVV